VSYILDSFTFCTQIGGTDIAYNLKITNTALRVLHYMVIVLLSLHQCTELPCMYLW